MKLKEGVRLHGIRPETVVAMMVVDTIYREMFPDIYRQGVTVTSVVEGQHSDTSSHYSGSAFDCRTWFLSLAQTVALQDNIQKTLGADWFVKVEKDHIHVGWRPKRLQ